MKELSWNWNHTNEKIELELKSYELKNELELKSQE